MSELRYAILRHEGVAEPHFDLLFESEPGGMLKAFRSGRWPIEEAGTINQIQDHRRIYLDYEGPISGGRGCVRCVERGTYSARDAGNGELEITLRSPEGVRRLLVGGGAFSRAGAGQRTIRPIGA